MSENTGALSFLLGLSFILASFVGIFLVFKIIKSKAIENENIDKIIELGKWFIASVAVTLSASIINDGFRERDQDIKESELFDKYVQTILEADGLEKRKLLCEYFSTVSPNGPIRNAWIEYKKVVDKHIEEDKNDRLKVAELNEKVQNQNASTIDLENLNKIEDRISIRNESLAPSVLTNKPRVFIHIGEETQRAKMLKFQDAIRRMGFSAPGIELITNTAALPVNPNVRYFNDEDAEAATQVSDQLKAIGFTTSYPYRVKGIRARSGTLEVWLSSK